LFLTRNKSPTFGAPGRGPRCVFDLFIDMDVTVTSTRAATMLTGASWSLFSAATATSHPTGSHGLTVEMYKWLPGPFHQFGLVVALASA
jgi:hypothetical protein